MMKIVQVGSRGRVEETLLRANINILPNLIVLKSVYFRYIIPIYISDNKQQYHIIYLFVIYHSIL